MKEKVTGELGQTRWKISHLLLYFSYEKDAVISLFDFYFTHQKLDVFPMKNTQLSSLNPI